MEEIEENSPKSELNKTTESSSSIFTTTPFKLNLIEEHKNGRLNVSLEEDGNPDLALDALVDALSQAGVEEGNVEDEQAAAKEKQEADDWDSFCEVIFFS